VYAPAVFAILIVHLPLALCAVRNKTHKKTARGRITMYTRRRASARRDDCHDETSAHSETQIAQRIAEGAGRTSRVAGGGGRGGG